LYKKSGRIGTAVRLAKRKELDNDIIQLSLSSNDTQACLISAQHFDEKGYFEKAAILYSRCGQRARAIEICFENSLFDQLKTIAEDLDENEDPELLKKVAEYFLENNQNDKAVSLLLTGGHHEKALELCFSHAISINEELAEKLTPKKVEGNDSKRIDILKQLGKMSKRQGKFLLASKLFTQAGNKIKAMKSLLNLGDTNKIIEFAKIARYADTFILAAN